MEEKFDQVIELLEKVYAELQGAKSEIRELGQRINKLEAIIENEVKTDIKTMYE